MINKHIREYIRVYITVILVINLFSIKAQNLDQLPNEIIENFSYFITDPNISVKSIKNSIKSLKSLSLVGKKYNKIANYIIEKLQHKYLNSSKYPTESAINLGTSFASQWLKNKLTENPDLIQELNSLVINLLNKKDLKSSIFLMLSGANANVCDIWKNSVLILAIDNKDKSLAKYILNKIKTDINLQNQAGNSALIKAVMVNSPDIVKSLIKAGANLNLTNDMGNSALKTAIFYEHNKIIKLLVNANANLI